MPPVKKQKSASAGKEAEWIGLDVGVPEKEFGQPGFGVYVGRVQKETGTHVFLHFELDGDAFWFSKKRAKAWLNAAPPTDSLELGAAAADFAPSQVFAGTKPGYQFRTAGHLGPGYYRESAGAASGSAYSSTALQPSAPPSAAPSLADLAARQQAAAVASGAASKAAPEFGQTPYVPTPVALAAVNTARACTPAVAAAVSGSANSDEQKRAATKRSRDEGGGGGAGASGAPPPPAKRKAASGGAAGAAAGVAGADGIGPRGPRGASLTDAAVCAVCSSAEQEEAMLLCDRCDHGYHLFCLTPRLAAVPEGEFWYCARCEDERDKERVRAVAAMWSHQARHLLR
jgi:hypothetical protein